MRFQRKWHQVGSKYTKRYTALFKNAVALEASAGIQTVVMDKTGTLTKGEPEVTDLITVPGMDEDHLLREVVAPHAC